MVKLKRSIGFKLKDIYINNTNTYNTETNKEALLKLGLNVEELMNFLSKISHLAPKSTFVELIECFIIWIAFRLIETFGFLNSANSNT